MVFRLGVLTTGRQDWGILRSTCGLLQNDPRFELLLVVGGMHCSRHFGETYQLIENEGFAARALLRWLSDDAEEPACEQAGRALQEIGQTLAWLKPDALLLVGDRLETAAAAVAATLERTPLIHIHGGEETRGAFDNALRHSVTKLSHLHLVSHEEHAARVRAMGEDPATIHVVGAPGLDNMHRPDLPHRAELEALLGLPLTPPLVVVTLHPPTLVGDPERETRAVLDAMEGVEATYVVTLPNADPGSTVVRSLLSGVAGHPRRKAVEALGDRAYWGIMRAADAVLGNSSSGLIEAPALELPAVNVGARQQARLRGANVIDVEAAAEAVVAGLRRALTPSFRASLRGSSSPYGDGRSGARIVKVLSEWTPPRPPVKLTFGRTG